MLQADLPRRALRAGPAPHKPTLSPAKTAAMQLHRAKSHTPGIPQSPVPPRKSAVTGQSPRNGLGVAEPGHLHLAGAGRGTCRVWGRPEQHSQCHTAGTGSPDLALLPALLCPRSGPVTCPPTCYIFRASMPEPRLLLTKPRAPDTTPLQGQISALATKSYRFLIFV